MSIKELLYTIFRLILAVNLGTGFFPTIALLYLIILKVFRIDLLKKLSETCEEK